MAQEKWSKIGKVADLKSKSLRQVEVAGHKIALSYEDGTFGAISDECFHDGGPLGQGCVDEKGYVVCPWHGWRFHRKSGQACGAPSAVSYYDLKEGAGDLYINLETTGQIKRSLHPLTRQIRREPGPIRIAGISTTVMNPEFPRVSTSELLLEEALAFAGSALKAQTQLLRLNELHFKACEGYYSKNANDCTWPCTITRMNPSDELHRVYEALVFRADVVFIATPIRWGAASSLYYKMAERLNCVENQMLTAGRTLIKDKVAAFIVTGGQDNIQSVAGQMMAFFSQLGFYLPAAAFVGHSRGWFAEDMENNVGNVRENEALKQGVRDLTERSVRLSKRLISLA